MKVLMLGWEFPPLFSGGLGIATLGIVQALSSKASVKLIVPAHTGSFNMPGVKVIGLNAITASELNVERLSLLLEGLPAEVHSIPLTISPYEHVNRDIARNRMDRLDTELTEESTFDTIHELFSDKEVYGWNVMLKMRLYTQLVEEIAKDADFDVVHAHDWITFSAGMRIKARTGKPLVLHVHSLETDRAGDHTRNEIYELEKKAMTLADAIISVSHFTRNQIHLHYGIDPGKITVVHNGITQGIVARQDHKLRDKLVVFLGRVTHQKGPEFLLETAEKVSRVYPRVKFVVAGTGDQLAHILETSAYKKLGSKFIFTGFLSKAKVDELLSMADVYFMPSVSEPFGITALEAIHHNVPSILSAQSGAAEVIKASLKAEFWDTDKYANYIYALLKYNALHRELSEHARTELESLTWSHTAEKIFNVYRNVTST
jgi:glycosyltransferase involved in cell wall biosynthesis